MANKKQFTLRVVSQQGVLYFGDCSVLFVPGEKDIIAIMAYHEPMLMKLGAGQVSIRETHATRNITEIKGGLLYVGENDVSVLVK